MRDAGTIVPPRKVGLVHCLMRSRLRSRHFTAGAFRRSGARMSPILVIDDDGPSRAARGALQRDGAVARISSQVASNSKTSRYDAMIADTCMLDANSTARIHALAQGVPTAGWSRARNPAPSRRSTTRPTSRRWRACWRNKHGTFHDAHPGRRRRPFRLRRGRHACSYPRLCGHDRDHRSRRARSRRAAFVCGCVRRPLHAEHAWPGDHRGLDACAHTS